MKNILIIPGSQRQQSINCRLARHLASLMPASIDATILEAADVDLPLFNQDMEHNTWLLERLKPIYQKLRHADGLIVVSPEYNASFSPYLKNIIDWVSRLPRLYADQGYINPFHGKALLLASATPGSSGGVLGLQSLRAVFTCLGSLTLAEQISLPYAMDAWEEEGGLIDPYLNIYIEETLIRFLQLLERTPIFSS